MKVEAAIVKLSEFTNASISVTYDPPDYYSRSRWGIWTGDKHLLATGHTVRSAFIEARRRLIDQALKRKAET